jgi:hypothetical protein
MPCKHTDLIIIDANDTTKFKYTDFASGQDATTFPAVKGNCISWIARSSGNLIGFRIDFGNKNGSPFQVNSIIVPGGGISPPQEVIFVPNAPPFGIGYTVTLSDLRRDDPQVVPVDNLSLLAKLAALGILPITTVVITVLANNVVITPDPITLPPGAFVVWNYANANAQNNLVINFISGSPFVGSPNPLPDLDAGTTLAEKVDNRLGNFRYTVSVGGGVNPANGTFTVQAPPAPARTE